MVEFDSLYKENNRKIYYYLKNICRNDSLAEDLTQETFYNALLSIYNGKITSISIKWLIKTAHNVFIDYLRKNKIPLESFDTYENDAKTADFDRSHRSDIMDMLNRLPLRYKIIIILKDHYVFSYTEIKEILGCSESTVKVTLFRARDKFKEVSSLEHMLLTLIFYPHFTSIRADNQKNYIEAVKDLALFNIPALQISKHRKLTISVSGCSWLMPCLHLLLFYI